MSNKFNPENTIIIDQRQKRIQPFVCINYIVYLISALKVGHSKIHRYSDSGQIRLIPDQKLQARASYVLTGRVYYMGGQPVSTAALKLSYNSIPNRFQMIQIATSPSSAKAIACRIAVGFMMLPAIITLTSFDSKTR